MGSTDGVVSIQLPYVVAFACLAAMACGDKQPSTGNATCEAVARHVTAITRTDLEALNNEEAKALLTELPELERRTAQKCNEEAWSDKLRACILKATTKADGTACGALIRRERKVGTKTIVRPSGHTQAN